MTGKFILRTDKNPNRFGEYVIALQYITQGIPVKTTTGLHVHPDFWLGDDGRSTKFIRCGSSGHPKGDMMNKRLLQMKRQFDSIIDSYMVEKNSVMTVPMLRSILNGSHQEKVESDNGKVPFVEYVVEHYHQLYKIQKISYSLLKNTQCYMNNFRKFLQKVKLRDTCMENILYCRDVTVELIKEYIIWRKDRGNSNDTINKSLTPIFKSLVPMTRRGWISRDVYDEICELYLPSNSHTLDKPKEEEVKYLTKKQMSEFIKIVDDSKYVKTKELMDLFLFSVYTGGMRISDICTLRWCEVDPIKRRIHHPQVKGHTKKVTWLDIDIEDESLKILMRWKGKFGNFVFGQLPDEFDLSDEEMLSDTISYRNRTIKQSLEVIGKKLNLPFKLHMHCARHTFAVMALNSGVNIYAISKIMGHSSTAITEKTYAKFLPETLRRISHEKLNFKFDDVDENVDIQDDESEMEYEG